MSSRVHFSAHDNSSGFDPDAVVHGVWRIGLLCVSILVRCQYLLGRNPEKGINAAIRQMNDDDDYTPALRARDKEEHFYEGDFVWTRSGHICEIVATTKSAFGFVAHEVRYLERPPVPSIVEDWYAAGELRLLAKKDFLPETAKATPEFRKAIAAMSDEEVRELRRRAVIALAQGLRSSSSAVSQSAKKPGPFGPTPKCQEKSPHDS